MENSLDTRSALVTGVNDVRTVSLGRLALTAESDALGRVLAAGSAERATSTTFQSSI